MDQMKSEFTNVYVKNLDEETTDEEFTQLFEQFGPVTSAAVSRHPDGKSKGLFNLSLISRLISPGFGFVNYDNHEHAAAAVEALNDKPYKSKNLYVGRAQKKSEREAELRAQFEQLRLEKMNSGVNLYVKNLDETIDEEGLRKEFEPYGTITSCKVMKDDKGVSKGA